MEKPQFIIVLDGSSYKAMYEHMLMDLSEREDVTFVIDKKKNIILKKILLKRKVQAMSRGRLDFLAYEENNLYSAISYFCEKKKKVFVLFLNAAIHYNSYMPETLLRYKKKWIGLKYILFYLDIMNTGVSIDADKLREKNIFDLIYSIDENDVNETGCIFWRTFYSKNNRYTSAEIIRDMYFCGVSKGRTKVLSEIAAMAEHSGAKVNMDIICQEDIELLNKYTSINVRKAENYLNYSVVLYNELQSACILEVVQQGQVAPTLRPYEAITYNRKLLTNNRSILSFPYWNRKYMQYFERPEDINWEWVKNKNEVDYQYDGRYSPIYLLNDIVIRLGE